MEGCPYTWGVLESLREALRVFFRPPVDGPSFGLPKWRCGVLVTGSIAVAMSHL